MENYIDKSLFWYDLPKELIAQEPLVNRSLSRLLVLDKRTGSITHTHFDKVVDYLNEGDCIVLNDTKVIPARLMGVKPTGAAVEVLLLRRFGMEWEAIVKPGRRVKCGDAILFGGGSLTAHVTAVSDGGIRRLRMEHDGVFEEILEELGETPLPPYITKKLYDKSRYQTVYAKNDGSAAAPTAGLHFTLPLLNEIEQKGVKIARVTLHVGLGTFRPIKEQNILEHDMHSEYYSISGESAQIINGTKQSGGRIICVGTTVVRTLESAAVRTGANGVFIQPKEGETSIFIYPGYDFLASGCMITNFHLPESTLMALVCAFAGTENVMRAYDEAVRLGYRFFSFGDAMLIV